MDAYKLISNTGMYITGGEQASLLHQCESGIPTDENGIKKAGLKPNNATAMQHPNPPYQSSISSASSPYYQLSSIEHSPSTQSQSPRPAASYDSHNAQRQLAAAAVLSNHGPSTSSVRLPAVASLNSSPEPPLDDVSKLSESQWSQPPDCRLPLCTRPGSMDSPPPYSEFDAHSDHSCTPYQDKCDKGANCVSSLHEKSENTTSAVECTEDMGLISPGKLSKVCEESRSQCDRNDVMITGVRSLYDSCVHTRAYENVPYSDGSTSTCTTFPVLLKSPGKPSNSCEEPHGQNDTKERLVTGMKPLCDSYVYTYMYGYGSASFSTHLEKDEKRVCPIIALSEDETSQQRDRSSTDKKCTPKNDFMGIAVHEEVEKDLISSHRFLKENSSEFDDKSEFAKNLNFKDSTIARNKTTSIKGPDTTCGVVCTTDTVQLSLAGIIGGCPRLCSFPIETIFTYNRNIAIAVVIASRCILSGVLQALIESGSMNSIVYPLAKVSLTIQSTQMQNVYHRYLPVSQSLSMQRCEKSTCSSTVSVDSSPKQRLKVICFVRKIYKFLKTCQTEVTMKCVFEANCDISNHKRQRCAIENVLPWRYMYKPTVHSKNELECDGLRPPVHQQLCDFSDHNAFKSIFYPASTQVHHRMQDVTQHNKPFRPVQTVMCFEPIIHHRKIIQTMLYSCSFSTHCNLTCPLKNNVTKLYDCSVLFHQPYQCSFTIAQDIPFLLPPTCISVDKTVLGLQIDNDFRNNLTIGVLNCLVTSALLSRIEFNCHDTRVVSQSINKKLSSYNNYNICAGIQSPNQSSTSIGTAMTCMLTISSDIIACEATDYVVCSSIWLNFVTVIHQAAVFLTQRAFLYIKSVSREIQMCVKGFHAHVLPQTLEDFLKMQFTIVKAKLLSEPLHLWVSPVSEVLHTFNTPQSLLLSDLNDTMPSSELSPCQEKSACYVVTKALSVVIPFARTELFKQVRIARCIICSCTCLNCVAALDTHVFTVKKSTRQHSRITCSSKRDQTNGLWPNITTDLSPLFLSYHELHASAMYFQSLVKYNVVESVRIVGLPKTTYSISFASVTSASINLCPLALPLNELSEYVTVMFSKMQLTFYTQVTPIPETRNFRGPQEKMHIMAPATRKEKSTINYITLNTISWPVQYTTDSGPLTSSCPVVLFTQLIGFEWVRFHIWKYLSIPPHSSGDQVTSVSYLYMLAHGQLAMTMRLKFLCWTLTSAGFPKRMDHNSLYGHECMLSLLHPHDRDRDDIKVITCSHLWAPSPSRLKFESTGLFNANKRGTFRSDTITTKQRPTSLNSEKMAVTFFMNLQSPRLLPKTPPLDLKQPTRVLSSPQSQGDAGSQSSGGSSGAQGNSGKGNKSSDNRKPVGGGSGQGSAGNSGNGERDRDDGDDHRERMFEGANKESQDEDGSEEKQAEDEEVGSNAWQKIGEQPDEANLSHCSAISSTTLLSPSLRKVDIQRAKLNSDVISVLPEFNKGNGKHSKRPTDWRLERYPSPGRLFLHCVHGKQNKSTEQEYQTHFSQPPDPVCENNTPADPYCGKNMPPNPGCGKNTPLDHGYGKIAPPDSGCGKITPPNPCCGKNTPPDLGCGQRVVPDPSCGKNTPPDPGCGKNTPPDPSCGKNTPLDHGYGKITSPDPGCGKNTPPDLGCGQRVVPDPSCGKNTRPDPGCGKNTPPDPGCGKNTPPDPGCGQRVVPDPSCGKNTPPDLGCGQRVVPDPSCGKNTPPDCSCGKNTPLDSSCGKNTPPDPGCGQRVVPDPSCGKNTPPDLGCGQRVVPDPSCGKNTPPDPSCGKNTPPDPGYRKNTPPDPDYGKNTPPDPGCGKNTPPDPGYGKNTPPDPGCGKNTPPDPGCGKNTPPDPGCGKNTPPDPGCGRNTPPDQLHVIQCNRVPHTNPSEQTHESATIPPIQKYEANNSETGPNQRFKSVEVPQDRQPLKSGQGLDEPLNNRYRSNVHQRTPLDRRSEIKPPEEEYIPISKSSTHEEQPPDQILWSDTWQGKSHLASQSETQAPQMEPPTEKPSTEGQVVKTVSHCFQCPASNGELSNHNSWCSSQLKGRQKSESALCAKSSSSSSTQQSCLVYMKSVFILLSSIKQNTSFVYLSVLSPEYWLYWNTSEGHGSDGVVRLRHHDNYKYFRCNKSESICSSDDYDFSLPVQQHGLTSAWNRKKFETYNGCNHNRYSELVTGMPSIPYIPQIHTNVLVYHFSSIHACNGASSSSSDDTDYHDASQSPEQASEIETESSHELESDVEDQKEKEVLEVRNEPGSTHESEDKCHGWEEAEENIKNGYSQEHLQRSRDGSCVDEHDFKEAVQCKDAGETNVDFVTHTKPIVQKAVCVLTPSDVASCSPGPPVLLGPGYTTFPIHAVPNCLQPETSISSDIIPVEESQFAVSSIITIM